MLNNNNNNNVVTKQMVYIDGLKSYVLKLQTIKYEYGRINVVKYELVTNHSPQKIHPFELIDVEKIESFEENKYKLSGIIADNIVSDALFTLIMANDEELYFKSGITEVQYYRAKLIKQLEDLSEKHLQNNS